MAANTDDNLIGAIRQRTEEEELKQHLKATVGGYTKSSVMEYLAQLRKRQQSSSETFNENMQSLLEEKETLKTENEKLLMQIAQAKADFMRLAEAKKQQELLKAEVAKKTEDAEKPQEQSRVAPPPAGNIVYLKGGPEKTGALEDGGPDFDVEALKNEASDKEFKLLNEIEALKIVIFQKDSELERSRQELEEHKELLAAEEQEAAKQRAFTQELSNYAESLQEELSGIKEKYSEETFNKLHEQIDALTAGTRKQEEVIARLSGQAAEKDSKIQTLLDENVTMMKSMEQMSNSLDDMAVQNEKLLTANNALAQAFEEENKKVVRLINEKSEETVEKLILERKLEDLVNAVSAEKAAQGAASVSSIA